MKVQTRALVPDTSPVARAGKSSSAEKSIFAGRYDCFRRRWGTREVKCRPVKDGCPDAGGEKLSMEISAFIQLEKQKVLFGRLLPYLSGTAAGALLHHGWSFQNVLQDLLFQCRRSSPRVEKGKCDASSRVLLNTLYAHTHFPNLMITSATVYRGP
jgi:hypothetical protein